MSSATRAHGYRAPCTADAEGTGGDSRFPLRDSVLFGIMVWAAWLYEHGVPVMLTLAAVATIGWIWWSGLVGGMVLAWILIPLGLFGLAAL